MAAASTTAAMAKRMSRHFVRRGNVTMKCDELSRPPARVKPVGLAALLALAVVSGVLRPAVAQESDVAEGQRIWAQKAQCPECHGWSGNGSGGMHSPGLAASLRTTQLTRDQIRMVIQCGRPGTPMPHFDRFAYTDKRCYDMTAQELGDSVPDRGAVTLQLYEIDALADYVATKIKGAGPITRGECLEFFKTQAGSHCDAYGEK
jgi:mono/diheme cytochrome c family protein